MLNYINMNLSHIFAHSAPISTLVESLSKPIGILLSSCEVQFLPGSHCRNAKGLLLIFTEIRRNLRRARCTG